MKIFVTGGSGLIGQRICKVLNQNQYVLTTRTSRAPSERMTWVSWTDPIQDPFPHQKLQGCDGIVHLMGESVAQRWSKKVKDQIRLSRIKTSQKLIQSIQTLDRKPKFLISASAIGFYGDRKEETLTEDSEMGEGFLAEVCQDWENEILQPEMDGVRRVCLRLGVVLSPSGGALAKMLPVFKLGLGGALGNGKQWMSWLHLDDLVSIVDFCIQNSKVSGVLNAVSPHPVRNKMFVGCLAKHLRRPAFFSVPKPLLKLSLGTASGIVLDSQRVMPTRLLSHGFQFRYSDLDSALEDLL